MCRHYGNHMRDTDQNQDHRLALVTGATGAIGKAIALEIAQQAGNQVVLLPRRFIAKFRRRDLTSCGWCCRVL